jgi:hypothetical protein
MHFSASESSEIQQFDMILIDADDMPICVGCDDTIDDDLGKIEAVRS